MTTLTVDDRRRVRLPDARCGQVFAYEPEADGSIRLLPVKTDAEEPFPRGSLRRWLTAEDDAKTAVLAKGSSLQLPE
jgi:hypothetical protein